MDTFTALADPTRRNIIEMIASRGELAATDISDNFSISPPAISQHLRVLREVKLVRMEKRAQQRIYSIDTNGIAEMTEWLEQMRRMWMERFNALDDYLKEQKSKTSKDKILKQVQNDRTKKENKNDAGYD